MASEEDQLSLDKEETGGDFDLISETEQEKQNAKDEMDKLLER